MRSTLSIIALLIAGALGVAPTLAARTNPTVLNTQVEGARYISAYTFLDPQHGWIVVGRTLHASSDGGATWRVVARLPEPASSLSFDSLQHGYAVVSPGVRRLETHDGGLSWVEIKAQPTIQASPDGFCKRAATMINARRGWVVCASSGQNSRVTFTEIFRTDDGGTTWQMLVQLDGYATGQFFLSEQQGWLTLGKHGIVATADGGEHWQALPYRGLPGFGYESSNLELIKPLFLSPERGFIVIESHSDYADTNYGSALYRTDDSGSHWRLLFDARPSDPKPWSQQRPLDRQRGIGIGTDDDHGAILLTNDRGRSWRQVGSLSRFCSSSGRAVGANDLSFISPQRGWGSLNCVEQTEHLLITTRDGGQTWKLLPRSTALPQGPYYLSFVDDTIGLAASEDGWVAKTQDGGMTWTPVFQAPAAGPIRFTSPTDGWQIRKGTLYRTIDGGGSWQPVLVGTTVGAFEIGPGGQLWIAVGQTSHRALLTSFDNGLHWADVRTIPDENQSRSWLPNVESASSIHFADSQVGWIVTTHGGLYTTTNAGRLWTEVR